MNFTGAFPSSYAQLYTSNRAGHVATAEQYCAFDEILLCRLMSTFRNFEATVIRAMMDACKDGSPHDNQTVHT